MFIKVHLNDNAYRNLIYQNLMLCKPHTIIDYTVSCNSIEGKKGIGSMSMLVLK